MLYQGITSQWHTKSYRNAHIYKHQASKNIKKKIKLSQAFPALNFNQKNPKSKLQPTLLQDKCICPIKYEPAYPSFSLVLRPPAVSATPEVNEIKPRNVRVSLGRSGADPPLAQPPSPLPCHLNSIAESIGRHGRH